MEPSRRFSLHWRGIIGDAFFRPIRSEIFGTDSIFLEEYGLAAATLQNIGCGLGPNAGFLVMVGSLVRGDHVGVSARTTIRTVAFDLACFFGPLLDGRHHRLPHHNPNTLIGRSNSATARAVSSNSRTIHASASKM